MKIVTSGRKYLDIDAYASMIAYRELLRVLGEDVVAVSTALLNQSVPKMIRDLRNIGKSGSGRRRRLSELELSVH